MHASVTVGDSEYTTGSLHLASFLLYVLGNDSHTATYRLGTGGSADFRFTFADPTDKCTDLKEAFFSKTGAAIENARGILVCFSSIKKTIRLADSAPDGIWVRSNAEEPAG